MFDKKTRLNRMLLRAAKRGDENKALLALAQGAEMNGGPATPLVAAITAGKWSMACLLVEKGADVQGAPPAKTPLIHAVERGDPAIVRLLLEAGAAPDAVHTYMTSHSYQVENKNSGVGGFFRETSYYTVQTPHHVTALTLAAHAGNSEIVRLLLGAGASRDLPGKDGMNAVGCAEASGHTRVAALLRAAPAPAPAPAAAPVAAPEAEQRALDIVFKHALGECILEEIFDFTARERISLIRKGAAGAVEISTRETFDALADTPSLRAAFDEHVRRGGTLAEKEIFSRKLDKPRMNKPQSGFSRD
jgi:hypothetical protein